MRIFFKVLVWLMLWPLLLIPKLWRIRFVGKPLAIMWSAVVAFFALVIVVATQLPTDPQATRRLPTTTPVVNALSAPRAENTPTPPATVAATPTLTETSNPTATPQPATTATATTPPTATSTPLPSDTPTVLPTATATPIPPVADAQLATVSRMVDGDTIHVQIDGIDQTVRYIGIDTPERGQPGYQAASEANWQLVEGQTIYLVKEISETDRNGRLLRQVYLADGRWVNGELVAQGWAQPVKYPPDLLKAAKLEALALEAAQAKRGFWSGTSAFDGAMSYALTTQPGNLRKGPGTEFEVGGNVAANTPLTLFGRNDIGDWVQVRLPDRTGGWMSTSLLAINVPVASIPVPANVPAVAIATKPPAPPSPTATAIPLGPIVRQGANLRAGPGTNYQVIGQATKSQLLQIVGKNSDGSWYKLANDAWIAASLVANAPSDLPVASAPPPPVQAVAPAQPAAPAAPAQAVAPSAQADCDPNYSGACIPNVGYDLDCGEIPFKNFRVVGYDHHRFDGDKDGIACES